MNLDEFGAWGLKEGQVGNPPPNYKYVGQCVSLIQQYLYHVFEMPFKAYGNAKDWQYNIPEGFIKLSNTTPLERGDILIYDRGQYGHLGMIDVNNKYYDQNGVIKLKIGYRDKPFNNYTWILRAKDRTKLGLNQSSAEEIKPVPSKVPTASKTKYQIGDLVVYSHCYRSKDDVYPNEIDCMSSYGAWQQRFIREIVDGKNPYKLDNGLYVNDEKIHELK